MLVRRILRLRDTGSTGVFHTQTQLHGELLAKRAVIVSVKSIDLFFIVEVVVLHQCRVRSIIIDTVTGICERNLGTCGHLILFEGKCKVKRRREYIYFAVLQITVIKIGSGYSYTVRSLSVRQEPHVTISFIIQVIHIPGHLFTLITPGFVSMEIQVNAVGFSSFLTVRE